MNHTLHSLNQGDWSIHALNNLNIWWHPQAPILAGDSVGNCDCRSFMFGLLSLWVNFFHPIKPDSLLQDGFELKLYVRSLGQGSRKYLNTKLGLWGILDAFSQKDLPTVPADNLQGLSSSFSLR